MSEKIAAIREGCKTMQSLDFSIKLNDKEISAQNETAYLGLCEVAFQKWHTSPSMPTPGQLRMISAFAKSHSSFKKVLLALPPDPMAYSKMGSDKAGNLFLGVTQLFFENDGEVDYILEHELGHLRDFAVVRKRDPKKSSSTDPSQIEMLAMFLSVANFAQSKKEGEEFAKLALPISNQFLQISSLELFILVAEAFRYGEEIHIPRMKKFLPTEIAVNNLRYSANGKSILDKLGYALFIARLQEMGAWESALQKLSKSDQELVKKIPPEYIAFFRTIIHASAKIKRPAID